jgi:hypothetical protein
MTPSISIFDFRFSISDCIRGTGILPVDVHDYFQALKDLSLVALRAKVKG